MMCVCEYMAMHRTSQTQLIRRFENFIAFR